MRVAFVTGASGVLGSAIARRLASAGYAVAVHYASNERSARAVVESIEERGGAAIAVQADVTDFDSLSAAFAGAVAAFGGVDVLVNNSGIVKLGPLADATQDDYRSTFEVSVLGTLNGIRLAASAMPDGGRIVNLSTTALAVTPPGMGVYTAAKAAVETLTRSAAKELASRGITVNAAAPGAIDSPMFALGKTEQQVAAMALSHPTGHLGSAEDVASAVALLVHDDARWISGQIVRVNGAAA
jgi:3-oxoacyl-[acyl-carrier protein] reductase